MGLAVTWALGSTPRLELCWMEAPLQDLRESTSPAQSLSIQVLTVSSTEPEGTSTPL